MYVSANCITNFRSTSLSAGVSHDLLDLRISRFHMNWCINTTWVLSTILTIAYDSAHDTAQKIRIACITPGRTRMASSCIPPPIVTAFSTGTTLPVPCQYSGVLPAIHCQKTESILVTLNFEGEYNTYDTLAEYGALGKDPVEKPYREAFSCAYVVG